MKRGNRQPLLLTGALASILVLTLSACFSDSRDRTAQNQAAAQDKITPDRDINAPAQLESAQEPLGQSKNGIRLVYPHDGSKIDAPSTFLVGAIAPGSTLTENGLAVKVNKQGFFAAVVPLTTGDNQFELVKNGNRSENFSLTVHRPMPPQAVPFEPLQIIKTSIQPGQDLGVEPGDLITFTMRASPGSQASVTVANRIINLHAMPKQSTVNQGLDTAFGVSYQQSNTDAGDLYTGFYRVTAQDQWQSEQAHFNLTRGAASISEIAPAYLTVVTQPFLASTLHDDTVVRVGPGAGRTTPLASGVRVLIDGYVGNSYRCKMCTGKHLWIEKKDLSENEGCGMPPVASVRTINIENEGTAGARIVIPLNQRLPYEIKQEITPTNRLQLKIYGATADTDWITEPSTSSTAVASAVNKSGKTLPAPEDRRRNPVGSVNWQQTGDNVYQVTVNINARQQWGFWADYDGTRLILHIKGAPAMQSTVSPLSLKGLRICLDPGHGGKETGAIGCSGIKEATLNLGIGQRTARILKEKGATVIMTRDSDVDVPLNERVAIAIKQNADLLVSIHNNSLPDGRDPWKEHGSSSYYYQPQSLALASWIKQGLVQDLGFKDFHTRWQNLALCRPSNMPAQLVEVGFVINPDEYAALLTANGQEQAAQGIAHGIHNFISQALSRSTPGTKPGQASSHRKR